MEELVVLIYYQRHASIPIAGSKVILHLCVFEWACVQLSVIGMGYLSPTHTQDRNLALQTEGVKMRVASDQPHFLAIDEDIFGTGLVLYYLNVRAYGWLSVT